MSNVRLWLFVYGRTLVTRLPTAAQGRQCEYQICKARYEFSAGWVSFSISSKAVEGILASLGLKVTEFLQVPAIGARFSDRKSEPG